MSDPIKSLAQKRCEAVGQMARSNANTETKIYQGEGHTGLWEYNPRAVKGICIEDSSGVLRKTIENKEVAPGLLDRLRHWWNS